MSTPANPHALLLAHRDELLARQARLHAHEIRAEQPLSADSAERAVEVENDDVVGALADAVRRDLAQVDAALRRLADGSYGRCVLCQGPIAAGRLAALPTAECCSDCAARSA